ncbi:serine kinase [Acerihabitans arboris]|uniref:Serine kinase n=1 Tax=Acerihabitans arboris TaxID=2691583 RepID=A0A845SJ29_9GAMM|nr:serine kinase [Acerihabitans arboris]NDL63372.1 serine kinase [Acerihabitans arboris]
MSDALPSRDDRAAQLQWLAWWSRACWQRADPGWRGAAFFAYSPDLQARLGRYHALEIGPACGISRNALPGPPEHLVLALSALSADELGTALALAAETCAPQGAGSRLGPARKIGCRRLAKALRPEGWLPEEPAISARTAGLFLLRAATPASWPRLRLQFPPGEVERAERMPMRPLPMGRLRALWAAAIWQSQQPGEPHHVDS